MISKPYKNIYRNTNNGTTNAYTELYQSNDGLHQQRALNVLINDLNTLFNYIEPAKDNYDVFSNRTFNILLRTCIQIESSFRLIYQLNSLKPNTDNIIGYSELDKVLKLSDYIICFHYFDLPDFKPFEKFSNPDKKLRSPKWYKDHNLVKHNRINEFNLATFKNVLNAVGALYCLIDAQYGSGYIWNDALERTIAPKVDGVYLLKNIPSWKLSEQYNDFDWDKLKSTDTPYGNLTIPA